jgi:3-hydroxybutyryl-CoA dehydrogenase
MKIEKVAILGGGQMGIGIAEATASKGVPVTLVKATPGSSDQAKGQIERSLGKLVERGKLPQADAEQIFRRIDFTDDIKAASDADLFIESIVEDLAVKCERLTQADKLLKPDAIMASNTSTLGIGAMQKAIGRKERFAGLHFFNPATVMKLVEVIPLENTAAGVVADLTAFVEHIGKTPVIVKDRAGFIVNRLLTPYMCDAIRAWESGLASIQGIDTAMQLGANHPMGPLSLADYIGLDIVCAMAENLHTSFKKDYMAPPETLKKLVEAGSLGRKTKKGFYDYSRQPAVPNSELVR